MPELYPKKCATTGFQGNSIDLVDIDENDERRENTRTSFPAKNTVSGGVFDSDDVITLEQDDFEKNNSLDTYQSKPLDSISDGTKTNPISLSPVTEVESKFEAEELSRFNFVDFLPAESSKMKSYGNEFQDPKGVKWRLLWFPNGNDNVSSKAGFPQEESFYSCYLEMIIDDTTPEGASRDIEFIVGIVNQADTKLTIEKPVEYHEFTRSSTDWGFRQFFSIDKAMDPDAGWLTEDKKLEISVRIQYSDQQNYWNAYTDYDSKKETGMVGLKNQGATCYMNSLLQTLYHLPKFRRSVYHTPTENEDTIDSVSLGLQRVFYRLQTYDKAVSTRELTKSFGWGHLESFVQHDVQELYRILCDRLEEKMKGTKVDNTIKDMFEGKVRSFIKCINVDFTSSRDESVYDIQLDVKGCKNMHDSFAKYTEVEVLSGENQYEAEGYGKQDAEKGLKFLNFPPVLSIHLKRFEYDPLRDGMVKVHDRFEYPERLELSKYVVQGAKGEDSNDNNGTHDYHLHSVLVHSGEIGGGHYYAFIKPSADFASDKWFKFEDDRITSVTREVAIDGNYGGLIDDDEYQKNAFGKRSRFQQNFSSAYMLVYLRESEYENIMKECEEIPRNLVTRFKEEEELARRKREEQEIEHLYMTLKVVTDSTLSDFDHYTKNNDFANFSSAHKIRVKKTLSIGGVHEVLRKKLGVPVANQRIWQIITRENKTTRPDTQLLNLPAEQYISTLVEECGKRKTSILLYLEVLKKAKCIGDVGNPEGSMVASSEGCIKKIAEEEYKILSESESQESDPMDENDGDQEMEDVTMQPINFAPTIGEDEILLFIKFYDPTKPLGQCLEYVGNIVISGQATGKTLEHFIRTHRNISVSKELQLYEEIQPSRVVALSLTETLLESDLQHGDIICYQFKADENGPASRGIYATVPDYFYYLLNRCEVSVRDVDAPQEEVIKLELLLDNSYSDVVKAIAIGLGMENPLFLRLYQHSSVSDLPKGIPVRHDDYADPESVGNKLLDLLSDYAERTNIIYYQKLEFPITDLEVKRQLVLGVSPFNNPSRESYLVSEDAIQKLTLLIDRSATIEELTNRVRKELIMAPDVILRLCELSASLGSIVCCYRPEDKVSEIADRGNDLSKRCQLLIEVVPEEDFQVTKTEVDYKPICITHFQAQGAGSWIQKHGTPFMTFARQNETFNDLRDRICRRMGIERETMEKWRFSIVHDVDAERLENDPGQNNDMVVFDHPNLKHFTSKYGYLINLGLEYPDPNYSKHRSDYCRLERTPTSSAINSRETATQNESKTWHPRLQQALFYAAAVGGHSSY